MFLTCLIYSQGSSPLDIPTHIKFWTSPALRNPQDRGEVGGGGGSRIRVRSGLNRFFYERRLFFWRSSLLFPTQSEKSQSDGAGESHGAWAGQLFPASRPPHKRRLPRYAASPVQTAALIKQQQQNECCYLIYKLPVLWRSGTAARFTCFDNHVETETPPWDRNVSHREMVFQRGFEPPTSRLSVERSTN